MYLNTDDFDLIGSERPISLHSEEEYQHSEDEEYERSEEEESYQRSDEEYQGFEEDAYQRSDDEEEDFHQRSEDDVYHEEDVYQRSEEDMYQEEDVYQRSEEEVYSQRQPEESYERKKKRKREGNTSVKKRRKNECGWWRLSLKTNSSPDADRQCSLEDVERQSLSPPRTSCFSMSNDDYLSKSYAETWSLYPQSCEEKEADCKSPNFSALLPNHFIHDEYSEWDLNSRTTEWSEYNESETMRKKRLEIVLPRIPSLPATPKKLPKLSKKAQKEPKFKETPTKKRKKKKKKKSKQKQKQEKVPGFRGVHCRTSLDGGQKYFSLVSIKGRKIYLGSFDTPEECAYEYDKLVLKARDHVPKHKINFPERFPEFYGAE